MTQPDSGTHATTAATAPPAPSFAAASSESFLPQSTVLIVDDNPQNIELLQAFLESLAVKIVTAVDGVDALEKVREHNPDLILLDIMMPRMSGFQVCRKLKGDPQTRDIQILMVTALNELGDIEQASECGTDDFVSKPVNKLELITRVKTRLTPALTPEDAARKHQEFLKHIAARLARMDWGRRVICHEPAECGDRLSAALPAGIEYLAQAEGDLGAKLAAAAGHLRSGGNEAVLFLGVDSPDLPAVALMAAANLLKTRDAVIGPTDDGGFWCVGLSGRVNAAALLPGIEWSSGRECAQTLERAWSLG